MAEPILVVLFLRGGMDGLNMISPAGDEDFKAARPEQLRVLRQGDGAGLVLDNPAADVDFRFHPQAGGLHEIYQAGEMAVVHASGLTDGTRSHFDAEDRMERAAPRASANAGGWLGRWLNTARPEGILPALALGGGAPESLRGSADVAVADALENLTLPGDAEDQAILRPRLLAGFGTHPLMAAPVNRLLGLSDTLSARLFGPDGGLLGYQSAADYPDSDLAGMLKTVAKAIKLDLGLRVASVDFGGWDTHEDQAGEFASLTDSLSSAISAFWRDLGPAREYTNVVIMSEFGRRLRANSSLGTDHGFGNAMMVLGGEIAGGRMLGRWPGLGNAALDDGADLAITTDYRHVLAEVMSKHMGGPKPGDTFPGFTSEPVGIYH